MSDFKELREALDAGPTNGPWTHAWGGGRVLIFQSGGGPTFASVPFDGMRDAEHAGANAAFIAAANPATIRSLLAELDEARRDAERWRWMRDEAWGGNNKRGPYLVEFKAGYTPSLFTLLAEEAADAAIDAAMKEQQP